MVLADYFPVMKPDSETCCSHFCNINFSFGTFGWHSRAAQRLILQYFPFLTLISVSLCLQFTKSALRMTGIQHFLILIGLHFALFLNGAIFSDEARLFTWLKSNTIIRLNRSTVNWSLLAFSQLLHCCVTWIVLCLLGRFDSCFVLPNLARSSSRIVRGEKSCTTTCPSC